MRVTKPIPFIPLFSQIFEMIKTPIDYLLNITLLFDRSARSLVVGKPVKYVGDSLNLTGTLHNDKYRSWWNSYNEQSLSNPIPLISLVFLFQAQRTSDGYSYCHMGYHVGTARFIAKTFTSLSNLTTYVITSIMCGMKLVIHLLKFRDR